MAFIEQQKHLFAPPYSDEKIEIVKKLEDIGERARKDLGDKLTSRIGKGVREIGIID